MRKNRCVLFLCAICGIAIVFTGCVSLGKGNVSFVGADVVRVSDADTRIGELVNSDEFARMDISERSEKARRLLEELQSEGLISNVYYDEGNSQYAYSYSDGSAGSISLERFRSDMN